MAKQMEALNEKQYTVLWKVNACGGANIVYGRQAYASAKYGHRIRLYNRGDFINVAVVRQLISGGAIEMEDRDHVTHYHATEHGKALLQAFEYSEPWRTRGLY